MKFLSPGHNDGKLYAPWIECVVITAGTLLAGFFFLPEDPFSLHAPFPWIWFASVLIALRYGIGFSMLSVIIIIATYAAAQAQGVIPPGFPKVFFIGGLMLTMLCGQFSTLLSERLRRATQLSDHAQERLEQLSRAYYMLRLSHDKMEQNLIIKPVTLRGALSDLRRQLSLNGGELTSENGRRFLSLVSQYCSMEMASLHLIEGNRLLPAPLASIGQTSDFSPEDRLVVRALEQGATSYSAVSELDPGEQSKYLVAAPLRVSNGDTVGLLLIEKMPFLSLNRENLQVLGVLLGYFADQAYAVRAAAPLLQSYPGCPPLFARETIKLARLKREFGIDSALVSIGTHHDPRQEQIMARLQRQQRGLDYVWESNNNNLSMLITLMPFAGAVAVEGYLSRVSMSIQNDFGISLEDPLFKTRVVMLGASEEAELYRQILGEPT